MVLGLLFLILTPIIHFILPKSVDINDSSISESTVLRLNDSNQPPSLPHKPISYLQLLSSGVYFLTFLTSLLVYFQFTYFEPILTVRLMEFGLSPIVIGFFFCLSGVGLMIFNYIVSKIQGKFDTLKIISFGILVTGFTHFL